MKTCRLSILRWAVCLLAAAQVISCALPLEKKFEPIQSIPEGKALVYIYRLAKGNDTGLQYYVVMANGATVVRMYPGGYFPYYCQPGRIQFSATAEQSAIHTVDIDAGQTYYLKFYLAEGIGVGIPAFEMMSPEAGLAELSKCKLIVEKKEAGF